MQSITIAIIGMGPRGLTVLERMLEHHQLIPREITINVDIFDLGDCGQGCHSSIQPDHLLINTVASQVTMFSQNSLAGGGDGVSSLQWAKNFGYRRLGTDFFRVAGNGEADLTNADHLPRSLLGEYLSWVYSQVVTKLPGNINARHHRVRIVDFFKNENGFVLTREDGLNTIADYIFLTTGHGTRKSTKNDHNFSSFVQRGFRKNPKLAYFSSPYPVQSLDQISPLATVVIQGFGLTAHDVISSLTLGRGGRYIERKDEIYYEPSGQEPKILLFSRRCLPFSARGMNQKGLAGRHNAQFFTQKNIASKRDIVYQYFGDSRLDFRRDVLPLIIKEMAYAYRCAEHKQKVDVANFEPSSNELKVIENILWPFRGMSFSSIEVYREKFEALLIDDLREAALGNTISPVKAATDVLRDTRETLRSVVEYGGLTPDSHRYFIEEFNAITNRVSFGPPIRRNKEYLALRDAGLIDIAGGPGAKVYAEDISARFCVEACYADHIEQAFADVLIIARLDSYSPLTDSSPLSTNLMARGLVRPYWNGNYHPGGIDIDRQLHPIGKNGVVHKNIWALGFLVEGPHFYTHALPRPHIRSRQTRDAEACVLELFGSIASVYKSSILSREITTLHVTENST